MGAHDILTCNNNCKSKRKNYNYEILESFFTHEQYPSLIQRSVLSEKTGLSPKSVQIWFQNQRARRKAATAQETHPNFLQGNKYHLVTEYEITHSWKKLKKLADAASIEHYFRAYTVHKH
ncbi:hypothetical protein ENBRE01_0931 [Enteropsectra breve]|nr:hypothetical protein ENBRE01_0931 [Enteropsectra breve]